MPVPGAGSAPAAATLPAQPIQRVLAVESASAQSTPQAAQPDLPVPLSFSRPTPDLQVVPLSRAADPASPPTGGPTLGLPPPRTTTSPPAVQRIHDPPVATQVLQRQEDPPPPEPAPTPEAAPPPVTQAPAPAAVSTAAPASGAPPEAVAEELVRKLFDPLLRKLKTELRLDRERRGRVTDRWR
ncbi:pyruvate/2-oxoglutarate dehydrogenase complex dihydrolipoamide acyltransferase (E2) component [Actinokineospora baliensis]|uniref:hypothetical protein n=1 Tax=Actinokineospora baliensis TaxID=547056 RepID=UPI001957A900|nr:hypothetical protein [Actinokineospora baliensis]MBM7773818.1 pyruvate/2-oxoglutarate dehydrogenase complex dihydrolipoamide acyltransferase (E2) component [Actinokineospora baliensis]